MHARHRAYGLDLQASFSLAGLPVERCESGLPSLALRRATLDELAELWSGGEAPPEWVGQLGDGCSLTIERGKRGDVLFSYSDRDGNRACFRLDAAGECLACSPLRVGLHWQQVLLGRILPNVAIMRGYEALHASAVDSPEGVVALAGPSGSGKTTLALELVGRGWPLFSDDTLVLGDGSQGVLAHPGSPHMNVAESALEMTGATGIGQALGRLADEHWIAVHNHADEPRHVRLICLLEPNRQPTPEGRILPANPLPLTPYILGLPGDRERERRRFTRYADLMEGASLMRLSSGSAARPADLADLIEQELAEQSPLGVGAGR